jgi:hypothetical protein
MKQLKMLPDHVDVAEGIFVANRCLTTGRRGRGHWHD